MKHVFLGIITIIIPPAVAGYYFLKHCQCHLNHYVEKIHERTPNE